MANDQNSLPPKFFNPQMIGSTYQPGNDCEIFGQSTAFNTCGLPGGDLLSRHESPKRCRTAGLPVRYVQSFLLFLCLCVNYVTRVNLSVGIVLMTDLNSTSSAKLFDWTVSQQSMTQSVFFVGYLFMNFAAAILVTKYNNKYLLLVSGTSTAAMTFLTPLLVTNGGYYALVAIRLLLGVMQGFMMSCMMDIFTRWIPPVERARCGAMCFGGIHVGNLISLSVSGWIGSNYGGWPSIFYFSGTVVALWVFLWLFFGAESPDTCGYVSEKELIYIKKELDETPSLPKDIPVPWKAMLKNKECWALAIAQIGHSWGYWTLLTQMPSYFNSVMKISPTVNGLVSALPYACMWIISFPASYISDIIVKKGILPASLCRKINNSIGGFGAGISLIILCNTLREDLSIVMYIIGVTLLSFSYIGHNITHLDITPNFAGFLMGITNGLSSICAGLGPLFVGIVVHDATNPYEWRIAFYVSAAIFIGSNLIFITLGTYKVQKFNEIPKEYFPGNLNAETKENEKRPSK